jgi:hypothetical protein
MSKTAIGILIAVMTACLTARAQAAPPQVPKDDPGYVKSQLKLKHDLLKAMGKEKLAESLAHVQSEWENLTPDQRRRFREQALAFLQKNTEQQEELLERYEQLIKMTAQRRQEYRQRADWLAAVTQWLEQNDPERVEQLRKMHPLDRAKELVALRDTLVREKKISLAAPTTQPAAEQPSPSSRPASQPSAETASQK